MYWGFHEIVFSLKSPRQIVGVLRLTLLSTCSKKESSVIVGVSGDLYRVMMFIFVEFWSVYVLASISIVCVSIHTKLSSQMLCLLRIAIPCFPFDADVWKVGSVGGFWREALISWKHSMSKVINDEAAIIVSLCLWKDIVFRDCTR